MGQSQKIKGRVAITIILQFRNQIANFMTLNWKLFLPIVIFVVILAVVLFVWLETKAPQVAIERTSSPIAEELKVLPPATGNIDDAVNAVFVAINNELTVLDEYDGDVSLIATDSQEVSDFGQAYDETAF